MTLKEKISKAQELVARINSHNPHAGNDSYIRECGLGAYLTLQEVLDELPESD